MPRRLLPLGLFESLSKARVERRGHCKRLFSQLRIQAGSSLSLLLTNVCRSAGILRRSHSAGESQKGLRRHLLAQVDSVSSKDVLPRGLSLWGTAWREPAPAVAVPPRALRPQEQRLDGQSAIGLTRDEVHDGTREASLQGGLAVALA